MNGDSNNAVYRMYPRPAVTCDSREDVGRNDDLYLHNVDRGITRIRAEGGRMSVAAVEAREAATVHDLTAMAFNGGPLPETSEV